MNICEVKRTIPPEYENFKLEDMIGDPAIIDPIKAILNNYKANLATNEKNGVGLLLNGRMPGNGKTETAYHILDTVRSARTKWDRKTNELTRGYTNIISILASDYLSICTRFEDHFVAAVQEIKQCPFLLLDDLSPDSFKSNLAAGRVDLFSLVDYRVSFNLPTIYTSNCSTLAELEKLVGAKLYSRIAYKTTIINFSGPDVRPIITEQLQAEINEG
jgi:DNA replication protein DnaC